jgi:hypothetical protein
VYTKLLLLQLLIYSTLCCIVRCNSVAVRVVPVVLVVALLCNIGCYMVWLTIKHYAAVACAVQ